MAARSAGLGADTVLRRKASHPPVTAAPRKHRQKAIANAGAVHAAMIGAEVETASTATPSSSASWADGTEMAGRSCDT